MTSIGAQNFCRDLIPTETAFVNPDNVDPVSACGLNMTQEVGCDEKYFLDPDVLER